MEFQDLVNAIITNTILTAAALGLIGHFWEEIEAISYGWVPTATLIIILSAYLYKTAPLVYHFYKINRDKD